jgi:hypothetical protein
MLDPGNYGGEYGFPIKVCETKDAAENFKNELSSKTFPNKSGWDIYVENVSEVPNVYISYQFRYEINRDKTYEIVSEHSFINTYEDDTVLENKASFKKKEYSGQKDNVYVIVELDISDASIEKAREISIKLLKQYL